MKIKKNNTNTVIMILFSVMNFLNRLISYELELVAVDVYIDYDYLLIVNHLPKNFILKLFTFILHYMFLLTLILC